MARMIVSATTIKWLEEQIDEARRRNAGRARERELVSQTIDDIDSAREAEHAFIAELETLITIAPRA